MIQIGSKVWEVAVMQGGDGEWTFQCEDPVTDIIAAFEGASTAVITRFGTETTFFDPQLLGISQDFQKELCTVRFSVKGVPDDVAAEMNESIEDAYDGLVDMGDYVASLEERIKALEEDRKTWYEFMSSRLKPAN